MICWTNLGPVGTTERSRKIIEDTLQQGFEDMMKDRGYVTIRMFYDLIGIPLQSVEEMTNANVAAEVFVDPDDWGWDEKGYRRLFETVTERLRL